MAARTIMGSHIIAPFGHVKEVFKRWPWRIAPRIRSKEAEHDPREEDEGHTRGKDRKMLHHRAAH